MTHAYDENLINKSRLTMARMLDTAVNSYGYDLVTFYAMFLGTDISERFGRGDSSVVAGRSGNELAYYVIKENVNSVEMKQQPEYLGRTAEFWTGWAMAYYQWDCGDSFSKIEKYAPIEKVYGMYHLYHEMDISEFLIEMYSLRKEYFKISALKRLRTYAKISQQELAEMTGVPLRTIQQYEQHQKDIKHARVDAVISLSRALHCNIEDILD